MLWLLAILWLAVLLSLFQWRARWRLAGGVTLRRWAEECVRVRGNMQAFLFYAAVIYLLSLPFDFAFDLISRTLIPIGIASAITAILGTTGPVSFLVLGPSTSQTAEICAHVAFALPMLRAGAAVNPLSLGSSAEASLGPSGNLWMSESGKPWIFKVAEMIEEAPVVLFDARKTTTHTREELRHLFMSAQLYKVIIVGPAGEQGVAEFLDIFGGVPIIELRALGTALRPLVASRSQLLDWYVRRRGVIKRAYEDLIISTEKTRKLDQLQATLDHQSVLDQFEAISPFMQGGMALRGEGSCALDIRLFLYSFRRALSELAALY